MSDVYGNECDYCGTGYRWRYTDTQINLKKRSMYSNNTWYKSYCTYGSYTAGGNTEQFAGGIVRWFRFWWKTECVSHRFYWIKIYWKHLTVSMYVPPSTPASPSTTVNSNALSDAHQVRLWGSRVEFLFYWVDVDSTEDDTPHPQNHWINCILPIQRIEQSNDFPDMQLNSHWNGRPPRTNVSVNVKQSNELLI